MKRINVAIVVLFSGCTICETNRIMHLSYCSSQYGFSVESECNDGIRVSTVVEQNRHGNLKALSFYSEDCILVCKVTKVVPLDRFRCQRISLNYCWQESFLSDLQVTADVIFLFASDGSFRGIIIPSVRKPDPYIYEKMDNSFRGMQIPASPIGDDGWFWKYSVYEKADEDVREHYEGRPQ